MSPVTLGHGGFIADELPNVGGIAQHTQHLTSSRRRVSQIPIG